MYWYTEIVADREEQFVPTSQKKTQKMWLWSSRNNFTTRLKRSHATWS